MDWAWKIWYKVSTSQINRLQLRELWVGGGGLTNSRQLHNNEMKASVVNSVICFWIVSHVSMQCMQSAILFYQFCLSVCLFNAGIVPKRVDLSSHVFDDLVGASF